MNEMAYVLQAWLPLIVWQQVDAPEYRKGYITVTFLSAALIVTAFTIRILYARERAKKTRDREESELARNRSSGSSAGEEITTVGKV